MQRLCLWIYPDLSRLRLLGRLIQNISVSIQVVVIYYIFYSTTCSCFAPLADAGGEAGFSLGWLQTPITRHAAAAQGPCHSDGSTGGFPGPLDN